MKRGFISLGRRYDFPQHNFDIIYFFKGFYTKWNFIPEFNPLLHSVAWEQHLTEISILK